MADISEENSKRVLLKDDLKQFIIEIQNAIMFSIGLINQNIGHLILEVNHNWSYFFAWGLSEVIYHRLGAQTRNHC